MDLTRLAAPRIALALAATGLAASSGCGSDDPASYSDSALLLPATLFEALPLATEIARDWSPNAFATSLGGGYAVMDAEGRSLNHSFEFHARFGQQWRRLTIDLVNGTPWTLDAAVPNPPAAFRTLDVFDSDAAVGFAIARAALLNTANPGTVPQAQYFAARLLSEAVWPEPVSVADPADSVAWRVDFLQLDAFSANDPTPVVPASGRELYPFP